MRNKIAYIVFVALCILTPSVRFAHAETIFSHNDHADQLLGVNAGNWLIYSYVASSSLSNIFDPIKETDLWLATDGLTIPANQVWITPGYSDAYHDEGTNNTNPENVLVNVDPITSTPSLIRFMPNTGGFGFVSSYFLHNYFRFSIITQNVTSTANLYIYGTSVSSSITYWSWQPHTAPYDASPYVQLITDSSWTPASSTNPDTIGITNNPLTQSSTTLSCQKPDGITDIGGGIAYGGCVITNFLFVPNSNSNGVQLFQNQLAISKTLFPFSLVFQTYNTVSSSITSGISSSTQDLYLNIPQINVHVPILTSSTLESIVGSSTKQMVFNLASNAMWLITGIASLWLII